MAALTTTTVSGGTQSLTQTPQSSAPSADAASTSSGGIQPGTSADLLRSSNGVTLRQTPVTTVSLTGTTQSATPVTDVAARHINGGLLAFSIILFVTAAVLLWKTSRPVNKTTI